MSCTVLYYLVHYMCIIHYHRDDSDVGMGEFLAQLFTPSTVEAKRAHTKE